MTKDPTGRWFSMPSNSVPKELFSGSPTVETILFSVPPKTIIVVREIIAVNDSGTIRTVKVKKGTKLISNFSVAINDTTIVDFYLPMAEGASLTGLVSDGTVVLTITGDVISE